MVRMFSMAFASSTRGGSHGNYRGAHRRHV